MKYDPIVCYLFTAYDEINSFHNFLKNYKKFNSGINHKLVICFKLLDDTKIKYLTNMINNINFTSFIDPNKTNDFDFGSYKRIAENYSNNQILFLNSHSYPICDDWLLKLINNSGDNILIGTSASFESILDSIKLKKKYKIFSHFFNKFLFKKNFNPFPNPHIRTSSFLLKGQKFLDFMIGKKIYKKEDTWKIESGKNSLSNYFKSKNYDIYVINSNGNKFTEKDWKFSETYRYLEQSKSIISDKHTRKYHLLNKDDKLLSQKKVWGN